MASWERTTTQQAELAILTPVGGFVQFLSALLVKNLQIPLPYVWHCTSGYPIDVSRDHLVKKALEEKVNFVFFLDTDVLPHPQTLVRLLASNLPIISGLYWTKAKLPCAYKFTKDPNHAGGFDPNHVESMDPATFSPRPMEVDAVGAGCLLIDARVFNIIPEPWFQWNMLPWVPQEESAGHSEDINFCLKAKQYGFPIYLDAGARCKHLLEGSYCLDEEGKFLAVL